MIHKVWFVSITLRKIFKFLKSDIDCAQTWILNIFDIFCLYFVCFSIF